MHSDRAADLREFKRASAGFGQVQLNGVFEGYASVFEEIDLGNDIVAPGAFTASLARRGPGGIRMLFQHDASEPVGVWEKIEETPLGLRVRGRLTLATTRGAELHELMRSGAIDGLSIGFRTVRARQDRVTGARRILEADLWEISIVTFPMQESARVESVKAGTANAVSRGHSGLPPVRDFERWLVRDAGLSRSDARTVIAKGYRNCLGQRDAVMAPTGLASRMRAAAGLLQASAGHLNSKGKR